MARNSNRNRAKAYRVVECLILVAALVASGRAQNRGSQRQVLVSISDRKLAVLENGRIIQIFPVSVGAAVSPSPTGDFLIVNRVANPTYYHRGVVIPAGRDNPIGPRWIGLSQKGYGIHGTNEPRSIGKAASHGCIRLRNADMMRLFAMVHVGDEVQIRAERDEEMAQIFRPVVTERTSQVQTMAAGSGQ
jgi:lipoprotein-anchoring transpeptidase ErfK/SrfK